MYLVRKLYEDFSKALELQLFAGAEGLTRGIKKPEVQRPGLSLAGFSKRVSMKRVLIFGRLELEFLRSLPIKKRMERLESMITVTVPAVIVSRNYRPPKELVGLCEKNGVALFRSSLKTMDLMSKLTLILVDEFSERISLHGTLVEVFGVGLLIQGESSVGKSEAALGLIERGHRFIADDIVKVKKKENTYLVGYGAELTRHLMEIRGIGIINVAHLYGAVCVRPDKRLDVVVKLEEWDEKRFYDRVGLNEKHLDLLDIRIPFHTLPVKPGRDVVLLLETIALNHRLKGMGYHSAKEFNVKLLETISRRQKQGEITTKISQV